jgi:hypothetical protein
MAYYPMHRQMTPLAQFRCERLLPVPGEVLVHEGDLVDPEDVVAAGRLSGKLQIVDVSQALGVGRDSIVKYLHKAIGDPIQAHEVLAERKTMFGWSQRTCRTPVTGLVLAVRAGRVLIEAEATTLELQARLRGQVARVIDGRGVVISSVGAVVQGSWYSGDAANGRIEIATEDPGASLRTQFLDESCAGSLLVAGRLTSEGALRLAADRGAAGIIAGSVDASMCELLRSLPYPVLIMEGFGALPMCQEAFSLLHACAECEAMIHSVAGCHASPGRPEVLVPLEEAKSLPAEPLPTPRQLEVGLRVRGLRAPHLGAMGTVTDLPSAPQMVESGARMPVAKVLLDDGDSVWIPWANLELRHNRSI